MYRKATHWRAYACLRQGCCGVCVGGGARLIVRCTHVWPGMMVMLAFGEERQEKKQEARIYDMYWPLPIGGWRPTERKKAQRPALHCIILAAAETAMLWMVMRRMAHLIKSTAQ